MAARTEPDARHTDEGHWPVDLPPASALRAIVEGHGDELADWLSSYLRDVADSAPVCAHEDHRIAGSLSSAVRRHRPGEAVDFDLHLIECRRLGALDVGFAAPQRHLCVIWGDLTQDQATYDGVVKALTATT